MEILRTLEAHYGDMQDIEFTIEEGRLYMLQTRNAKRPAQAAVRFAADAVAEGLLTREQALLTIDAGKLDALLHPTFDPHAEIAVLAHGVPASPGAAKGEIVFTAPEAVEAAAAGRDVILVRPFTEADDVAGFDAARGILTSEGGKASHAALVARGMGRPCVCGASALEIDLQDEHVQVGDTVLRRGDRIAIDGSAGIVTLDDVPLVEARWSRQFETVLGWCDELRTLGVRANADTPEDAARAREYGAEGIGLCRTEHMFMAADRQPKMRAMIMAADEEARRAALAELLPLQQADFEGLFEAMEGEPVTIRLLDPPLHEFLPHRFELERDLEHARNTGGDVSALERTLERVHALEETNPMLGTRGCRLGILYPEVYEMQAVAIAEAAKAVRERTGKAPLLEVMIPLVDYETELELMRDLVVDAAHERGLEAGRDFLVGTMIELPRACFLADAIAHHADFFSFGTNDLTQTALGFSRDDVEGKFLSVYLERKIVDRSPFETIDAPGVGQMVRMGAWLGRKTKDAAQARRLRRARRRPRLDRLLPPLRHRLRLLLALPRPDRAGCRGAGGGARGRRDVTGIQLQRLSKTYDSPEGPVHAVREIDVAIAAGETVALLGPNGAGKSTTIDMLLGLAQPDAGEVSVFGRSPADAVAAGAVGAMLQTGELIRDLDVRELVAMVASLYPAPLDVEETIELCGLGAVAERRTQKLSGGQTQRVRFAVALVCDPELLVLDEPTVAMDVESRRAFWETMRAFAARGKTVLFATHYLEEADAYADRVVLMAHGRVVADGPPTEIKSLVGSRTIRATLPGAALDALAALPGVTGAERRGEAIMLTCADSDAAIRALLATHPDARDIEIGGAGLEQAFLALTSDAGAAEGAAR